MKVTRGMQRKSQKLARRRSIVGGNALVAGIDLAKRESIVLFLRASDKARLATLRVPTTREGLLEVVRRGQRLLAQQGMERLVVGMESTGHFWKVMARAAEEAGVSYVLVQPLILARSRELDDMTQDKTDLRDAGLIAELVSDLRFTEVQLETDEVWARLRMLAEARNQRSIERRAALNEQRSLLELIWPQLPVAMRDLNGRHFQAALSLGLTPDEIADMSLREFTQRLRSEYGIRYFRPALAERVWTSAGVSPTYAETPAAVLRLRLAAERIRAADQSCRVLEEEMVQLFENTGLGWLRGQLKGLGSVLLLNLLAICGDPRRYDSGRCLVKLAGMNPTERSSGEQQVDGGIHRRGRPSLRFIAHQAAVNLVNHHPDFRRRFELLTSRNKDRLTNKQAYIAVACKLLRTLWALAVTGRPYDGATARGERRPGGLSRVA
jgi:transposase